MRPFTDSDAYKLKQSFMWKRGKDGQTGRVDKLGNPIEFRLTFDEWFDIWYASGHIFEMGTKKGQYCMSRKNDIGHYEVGNVFIQLHTSNSREAQTGFKRTPEHQAKLALARVKVHENNRTRVRPQAVCPHCKKAGDGALLMRWHFDNCKLKTTIMEVPAMVKDILGGN